MAVTTLRGNTQILALSITDGQISTSAAIATSKLADSANFIMRGGGVPFTGDQSMGSNKLTSVGTPTAAGDAANKGYVDGVAQGLRIKAPVEGATTAPLNAYTPAGAGVGATLTKTTNGAINSEAVDSVTFAAADRILIKNETAGNLKFNGIYVVTTVGSGSVPFVLTRATDADEPADITEGAFVMVIEGATLAGAGFVQLDDVAVVDTDAVAWEQFSGAAAYTAGNGLQLIGSAFSILLDTAPGLSVSGSGLKMLDLTSAYFMVGNVSNRPTGVAMSGDATTTNAGVITVANQVKLSKYIVREVPSGSINSSNVTFTLANTPVAGSETIYLNGLLQAPGGGADYTISTNTISYNTAPLTGDLLVVSYISS